MGEQPTFSDIPVGLFLCSFCRHTSLATTAVLSMLKTPAENFARNASVDAVDNSSRTQCIYPPAANDMMGVISPLRRVVSVLPMVPASQCERPHTTKIGLLDPRPVRTTFQHQLTTLDLSPHTCRSVLLDFPAQRTNPGRTPSRDPSRTILY